MMSGSSQIEVRSRQSKSSGQRRSLLNKGASQAIESVDSQRSRGQVLPILIHTHSADFGKPTCIGITWEPPGHRSSLHKIGPPCTCSCFCFAFSSGKFGPKEHKKFIQLVADDGMCIPKAIGGSQLLCDRSTQPSALDHGQERPWVLNQVNRLGSLGLYDDWYHFHFVVIINICVCIMLL